MNLKRDSRSLLVLVATFFGALSLPVASPRFQRALLESLSLLRWYTREHVVLCLLPALFIAGAITVLFSKNTVLRYLGAKTNRLVAYLVASVSGALLAVCSCTVLPLFSGIYRLGAGIGPATAFLYAGPAINVLAVLLTARILGPSLGVARAVGAVLFSLVIGLVMELFFGQEPQKQQPKIELYGSEGHGSLRSTAALVGTMLALLVFANVADPQTPKGFLSLMYRFKWYLTGCTALLFLLLLKLRFSLSWRSSLLALLPPLLLALLLPHTPSLSFGVAVVVLGLLLQSIGDEGEEWLDASWGFAKQILPLLFIGVLLAGFLLGSTQGGGILPTPWIHRLVGGNSLMSTFFASFTGAFMYFATLTEIPILEGLMRNGMGKGPALALLLAGPALSLPNILVIKSVMGTKRTMVFVALVVVLATLTGFLYGLTPW